MIIEADTKQTSMMKVKISQFAKIIKSRTILAGLCMSSVYFYRDKRMLHGILAILGGTGGFAFMLTQADSLRLGWMLKSYISGLNITFFVLSSFFGVSLVSIFLSNVRYSEHWKASWIFKVIPLTTPLDLWRGSQITGILYIVIPYTLLLSAIAIFFWGGTGILYVLPTIGIYLI